MTRFVAICGEARHGKGTIASVFESFGYTHINFADPIKRFAEAINPFLPTMTPEGRLYRLSEFLRVAGSWDEAKKEPEVRRLIQTIGTEGGRSIIDEDVWVDIFFRSAAKHDKVVVSDLRVPNEERKLRSRGALILKVIRPNYDNGLGRQHETESYISQIQADVTFTNNSSVDDLVLVVRDYIIREGL